MIRFIVRLVAVGSVLALGAARSAARDVNPSTGAAVTDYNPGDPVPVDYLGDPFTNENAPIGLPKASLSDGSYLSPFNAPYLPDQMIGVGPGGSLTIQMSSPISTSGFTLGVHAAVGLDDADYPNGTNTDPAGTYTNPRSADVRVSQDGKTFFDLGDMTFDMPSNYYTGGLSDPSYPMSPGTGMADFAQPFTGSLSDFDGKDWDDTLAVLNGSGGGTWLDLSGTGLSSVDYVRFITGDSETMFVQSLVGIPAPEPATAGVMALGGLIAFAWRRR